MKARQAGLDEAAIDAGKFKAEILPVQVPDYG